MVKSKRTPLRWPIFLLQWILVMLILDQVNNQINSWLWLSFGESNPDFYYTTLSTVHTIIVATIEAILQYWILRRLILGLPRYWITVSAAAIVLSFIANDLVRRFVVDALLMPSDNWFILTIPGNLIWFIGPAIAQSAILQRYVRYAWLWILGNFGVLIFWITIIHNSSIFSYRRTPSLELSAFFIGLGFHIITGLTLILIVKLTERRNQQRTATTLESIT